MQPSEPCPWCACPPPDDGAICCRHALEAEEACEALEASENSNDEALLAAALTYWPDIAVDLAFMRHPVSHHRNIVGTEHMNHTTNGARRAA